MNNEHDPIYIGKWADCGCISAVCVDDPKHKKDTAKFVKEIVASGRIVEHHPAEAWEELKKNFRKCPHHK